MKKFCPKCGTENENKAKFCKKCGYNFTERTTTEIYNLEDTNKKREDLKQNTNNKNKLLIVIIIVLVCVIAIFILREINSNNESKLTSSTNTVSSSSLNGSSVSSDEDDKLTIENNPKLDAAALIYYVSENNISDSSIDSQGYIVRLPSNSELINSLSKKGQNQVYEVYREENRNDGGPVFVYTINSDDTINIYRESEDAGFNPDETYDPVKSISKSKVIEYLNDHNMASEVRNLSNQVEIQQTDKD